MSPADEKRIAPLEEPGRVLNAFLDRVSLFQQVETVLRKTNDSVNGPLQRYSALSKASTRSVVRAFKVIAAVLP